MYGAQGRLLQEIKLFLSKYLITRNYKQAVGLKYRNLVESANLNVGGNIHIYIWIIFFSKVISRKISNSYRTNLNVSSHTTQLDTKQNMILYNVISSENYKSRRWVYEHILNMSSLKISILYLNQFNARCYISQNTFKRCWSICILTHLEPCNERPYVYSHTLNNIINTAKRVLVIKWPSSGVRLN